MHKYLFFLIGLLSIGFHVNAQRTCEWTQYGLSFTAPEDFEVKKDSATLFQAENENIHVSIKPLDYNEIRNEKMRGLLARFGVDAGMNIHDVNIGELRLSTLNGVYIEGLIGDQITIIIMLIDVQSETALLASVVYENNPDYDNDVANICNSFTLNKK